MAERRQQPDLAAAALTDQRADALLAKPGRGDCKEEAAGKWSGLDAARAGEREAQRGCCSDQEEESSNSMTLCGFAPLFTHTHILVFPDGQSSMESFRAFTSLFDLFDLFLGIHFDFVESLFVFSDSGEARGLI